jgi:transcription initiation factor TFIIIB Brf1 subunit/transcription initiation factor TFIIB
MVSDYTSGRKFAVTAAAAGFTAQQLLQELRPNAGTQAEVAVSRNVTMIHLT